MQKRSIIHLDDNIAVKFIYYAKKVKNMKLTNLLLLGALSSNSAQAFDLFAKAKDAEIEAQYNHCIDLIYQDKPSEDCITEYSDKSRLYKRDPTKRIQTLHTIILDKERKKCETEVKQGDYSCIDDLTKVNYPDVDYRVKIRELQDDALGISFDICYFMITERSFTKDERKACISEFERLSSDYESDSKFQIKYLKEL